MSHLQVLPADHPHRTPRRTTLLTALRGGLHRGLPGAVLAGLLLAGPAGAVPHPSATFVSVAFQGCAGSLAYGQNHVGNNCSPPGRGLSASAWNLQGTLQAAAAASASSAWAASATATAGWGDSWTLQAGPAPASALFSFRVHGDLSVQVIGADSPFGSNDLLFNAALQPVGNWAAPGGASANAGTWSMRLERGVEGTDQRSVDALLQLPVSLAGMAVGDSLDMVLSLQVTSAASAGRGASQVHAVIDLSHTAGLAGLQFFDATGTDISGQVQGTWLQGTQLLPPVPEPRASALLLAGLAGLAALAPRRRAAQRGG